MIIREEDLPYKIEKLNTQVQEDIFFKLKMIDNMLESTGNALTIYMLGGAACIISELLSRVTMDIDIIDIDYKYHDGRFLNLLEPLDILEFSHTTIPPNYQARAKKIDKFTKLLCYVLSPEDIIVSKLVRYSAKDKEDIFKILLNSNKKTLNICINEMNEDLKNRIPKIQTSYINNLAFFKSEMKTDV